MPIIKSAKKRVEVTKRNTIKNKSDRNELRTEVKKFNALVAEKKVDEAAALLPKTFEIIDENVTKNIIHKNRADDMKARLSTKLVKLQSKTEVAAEEVAKKPAAKKAVKKATTKKVAK